MASEEGVMLLVKAQGNPNLSLIILLSIVVRTALLSLAQQLKQNNNNTILPLDTELISNLYSISLVPFIGQCFDNIAPTSSERAFYSSVFHRLDFAGNIGLSYIGLPSRLIGKICLPVKETQV